MGKQDEQYDKMRELDEALLKLAKQGHRKLIKKIIFEYLQQSGS